jgi:hypothetical protein
MRCRRLATFGDLSVSIARKVAERKDAKIFREGFIFRFEVAGGRRMIPVALTPL